MGTEEAREITLSEIMETFEPDGEEARALSNLLRELPESYKGQLEALSEHIAALRPATERAKQTWTEVGPQLARRFMDALKTLIEQRTEGNASAEDVLQREMNEWFENLQTPLQRLYTALSGPLWLHLKTKGMASEILETVADGAAMASVDTGFSEEYSRPKADTPLADALSEWGDEGPPVRVLHHTSLAAITWGELHEAALENGATWDIRKMHRKVETAMGILLRIRLAEMIEDIILQTQQPIRFRDDRALTGGTETSEAEAEQLPAPTEREATNRPPIPEDADPFGGRKAGRKDHCVALLEAWDKLSRTTPSKAVPTKDELHHEAGGEAVRKGVERALNSVGWWPIEGGIVEYTTAVEHLLNWHNDRA